MSAACCTATPALTAQDQLDELLATARKATNALLNALDRHQAADLNRLEDEYEQATTPLVSWLADKGVVTDAGEVIIQSKLRFFMLYPELRAEYCTRIKQHGSISLLDLTPCPSTAELCSRALSLREMHAQLLLDVEALSRCQDKTRHFLTLAWQAIRRAPSQKGLQIYLEHIAELQLPPTISSSQEWLHELERKLSRIPAQERFGLLENTVLLANELERHVLAGAA